MAFSAGGRLAQLFRRETGRSREVGYGATMAAAPNLPEALKLLSQILARRRSRGEKTVAIEPASLERLRALPSPCLRRATVTQPPAASATAESETPTTPPAAEHTAPDVVVAETADTSASRIQPEVQPAADPGSPPDHPYGTLALNTERRGRIEIIHPAGETVREKLNNLFRIAKADREMRGLDTLRDQLVFATGNPEAELMFVGEAPGSEEEKQKKPFVGPAGNKLDQIIGAMGLARDEVYISNIVKYRPRIGDGRFQGPKNRPPTPDEISLSVKYVRSEIEVIRPRDSVALGGTAAYGLLYNGGAVGSLRGRFHEIDGIPVAVTYHPSYLLRFDEKSGDDRGRQDKRKVWEDMLMVMEHLGLPISEKQRRFFAV